MFVYFVLYEVSPFHHFPNLKKKVGGKRKEKNILFNLVVLKKDCIFVKESLNAENKRKEYF